MNKITQLKKISQSMWGKRQSPAADSSQNNRSESYSNDKQEDLIDGVPRSLIARYHSVQGKRYQLLNALDEVESRQGIYILKLSFLKRPFSHPLHSNTK